MSATSQHILQVIFRPTAIKYNVQVDENSTVQDVIIDVCKQAKFPQANNCFLWLNSKQLSLNNKLNQCNLYPIPSQIINLAEVRFKFVVQLQESNHIGKHVTLASTEQIDYNELLDITLPCSTEHTKPSILRPTAEQIFFRASPNSHSLKKISLILIPLPVFSKQSIDYLPTVYMTLPDIPAETEWKRFIECLVQDLDLEQSDIVVVDIENNPIKLKIKFTTKVLQKKKYLEKLAKKLSPNSLSKTRKFIDKQIYSTNKDIKIELENFNMEENILDDNTAVTSDYIDLALRLSERAAVIDSSIYEFLTKKSRQITTCLLNSFQQCSNEYVIDHIELLYHDKYLHSTLGNEKILFHGTNVTDFEDIFENFQFLSRSKLTEDGQYGRGYYFSSLPRKAVKHAKFLPRSIIYLLCAVVKLGNTLTVTDASYKNKDIQVNYDSHYIPMDENENPISNGQNPISDEYVIKRNDQILPLYIIGLRHIYRFVIWRDAKITNDSNTAIFQKLKQLYDFNLYGCQSNIEVFDILNNKLLDHNVRCVVITNGGDNGEEFVRKCRKLRPDIPVAVFCTNVAFHEPWAMSLEGPKIKVTDKPGEIITFIDCIFKGLVKT